MEKSMICKTLTLTELFGMHVRYENGVDSGNFDTNWVIKMPTLCGVFMKIPTMEYHTSSGMANYEFYIVFNSVVG